MHYLSCLELRPPVWLCANRVPFKLVLATVQAWSHKALPVDRQIMSCNYINELKYNRIFICLRTCIAIIN